MSARKSGCNGNSRRHRGSAGGRNRHPRSVVPIPEPLRDAVEVERDNLSRADSILGCLVIALEYGSDADAGCPYYPDVARVARELVRTSINGLDSLHLEEGLSRHKIKEEIFWSCAPLERATPLPLVFRQDGEFIAPKRRAQYGARAMRLHRRAYGRTLSRKAATADSASANICG
jgi:hypothetical protein